MITRCWTTCISYGREPRPGGSPFAKECAKRRGHENFERTKPTGVLLARMRRSAKGES